MTTFKPNDRVIAPRFVGPPLIDGIVVTTGTKKIQALAGESEEIPTVTVRFADGYQAELDARAVLPGGPNYVVRTPVAEKWCDSAEEISAAIAEYITSSEERKSLAKVSVMLMPPNQRAGVGLPLNPTDFYVGV